MMTIQVGKKWKFWKINILVCERREWEGFVNEKLYK